MCQACDLRRATVDGSIAELLLELLIAAGVVAEAAVRAVTFRTAEMLTDDGA